MCIFIKSTFLILVTNLIVELFKYHQKFKNEFHQIMHTLKPEILLKQFMCALRYNYWERIP